MLPGLSSIATRTLSTLPAADDLATANPVAALLRNPSLKRRYLMVATPYDPLTGATATVYLADGYYATGPSDSPAHQLFRNRLREPYNLSNDLLSGGVISTRSTPSAGNIVVNNPPRRLSGRGDMDYLCRYKWSGQDFTTYLGPDGAPFSSFAPICKGKFLQQPIKFYDRIEFPVVDPSSLLQRQVQNLLYLGLGYAVRLDGATSYLSANSTLASVSTEVFELRAVVEGANGAAGAQVIAAYGSAFTLAGLDFYIGVTNAGLAQLFIQRSSGSQVTISATTIANVMDGNWHHYAVVLAAGTNACQFYIDGVLQGSATQPTFSANASAKLWVGAVPGGTDRFLAGQADEVRLWQGTRTTAQILTYSTKVLPTPLDSSLKIYWGCDEGTGTTVNDATAGHNNGTLNAGSWVGTLEGGPELMGRPKPILVGQRAQIQPVPVDSIKNVYQWHYRSGQGIVSLADKGGALVSDGDVSNVFAWTAVTGHFVTNNARGLLRTGSTPQGVLSANAQGDNVGGYVSTTADCLRRAAAIGGVADPSGFDLAALARINLAQPATVGIFCRTDPRNVDQLLDELMSGVFGWWGFNRLSQLTAGIFVDPGIPITTLTERDVVFDKIEEIQLLDPPWQVQFSYKPYDVTQDTNSVVTTLTPSAKEDLAQQYRIVQATDTDILGYSVLARTPLSLPLQITSTIYDQATALAEATRELILLQDKSGFKVPLTHGLFQYDRGDSITLKIPRWDLERGHRFTVLGWTENVTTNEADLVLWGGNIADTSEDLLLLQAGGSDFLIMNSIQGDRLFLQSAVS